MTKKIQLKLNVNQLDRIIICLINNPNNKKFAANASRLFKTIDISPGSIELEKEFRINLIKEICKIILENKIDNKEAILAYLDTNGKYYDQSVSLLNNICEYELPENEIALLDKTISNQLKYNIIIDKSAQLSDMLTMLNAEQYENLDDYLKEVEEEIDGINRNIKSARESIENAKNDLSLSSNGFLSAVNDIIIKERNPATKVKTGIQYLNTMLNGGFEKGRLYCALGMAKGWKSGFMLNCAIYAKRYNQLQASNPKLKPVIVYLSMENTNEETIKRLWAHCRGNNDNIADHEPNEVARTFEEYKLFTPNDPNSPELLIWYRPNRSITTADLNMMLEDLKTEGKEAVFLILDYLKRIRPTEYAKDLRIELSNITNELKTIAMEQDIPILTGMQLNREAFRSIEEADTFESKIRASDKLGASNVGESIDIIQNADYSFIVNKLQKIRFNSETNEVEFNDRYLFIKLVASRGKQPNIISFNHRFSDNNDMRLREDIYSRIPESILTEVERIKNQVTENEQRTKNRSIITK